MQISENLNLPLTAEDPVAECCSFKCSLRVCPVCSYISSALRKHRFIWLHWHRRWQPQM